MDEQRARIHDDLRGLIEGEILVQPIERLAYRGDAGRLEVDPQAVIHPRTESDLVALVKYAQEERLPIHPRGAGAFAGGGAIGPGLVVDFSRHFRRILELHPNRVVVQAGVVLGRLNDQLAPLGRRIGPDPSDAESHTIGGLIGRNACGPRYPNYGAMANHVESLRVVFASGDVETVARVPRVQVDTESGSFLNVLAQRLHRLAAWNAERYSRPPGPWSGGNPGYSLHEAFASSSIDLARLITGSEGTLALISEATLRTVPIPRAACALVLPFGRLVDAASAIPRCLEERPSACELFDWRNLSLARDAEAAFRAWIPEVAEAALLVEFEGETAAEVSARARKVGDRLYRQKRLAAEPVDVPGRADAERLLDLRKVVSKVQLRRRGPTQPVEILDDLRLPPEALPPFLERLQALMQERALNWTLDAEGGI
ncbi:MAG TPA: FAD-binding oxidoreductase, partial [Isosphaeraceae bacterium]|nr:FAD-binding oxidoreductase [Isosphaeraceae bacterium]